MISICGHPLAFAIFFIARFALVLDKFGSLLLTLALPISLLLLFLFQLQTFNTMLPTTPFHLAENPTAIGH